MTGPVAIQGEPGAFSHQAARQLFGEAVEILPCRTFTELFGAVVEGRAAAGAVPVENTLAGPVAENLDHLSRHAVRAVRETQVRVELCLIAPPGRTEDSLRRVASHPVALRQCRGYFAARPEVEEVAAYDTAGAVRDLLEGRASWDGAIGSALAAELYGGRILRRGLEDDERNHTRFLGVVAGVAAEPGEGRKASVSFTLPHRPGALYDALGVFAVRGVDLDWIVSRPIPGRPWEYRFHVDVSTPDRAGLGDALGALAGHCGELRLVGAYRPEA